MWNRIKAGISRTWNAVTHWFRRCNGPDNLGMAILIASLVITLLTRIFGLGVLALLSMCLYGWAIFRMLSHKKAKRMEENRRFTQGWMKLKTELRQAVVRMKNIRKYKYYKCPNCKARLRMPRGIGEKTVTCSQCKHSFKQKA